MSCGMYRGKGFDNTGGAYFDRSLKPKHLNQMSDRMNTLVLRKSVSDGSLLKDSSSSRGLSSREGARALLGRLKLEATKTMGTNGDDGDDQPAKTSKRKVKTTKHRKKTSEFQTFPSHSRDAFLRGQVTRGGGSGVHSQSTVSRPCTAESGLSGFKLEEKALGQAITSQSGNHARLISSRPTFGMGRRFEKVGANNCAPGPKYDWVPMVTSEKLARGAPACIMGGAGSERDAMLKTRITNNGLGLCHLTAGIGSDVGSAGYRTRAQFENASKHKLYPEFSWGVSRTKRFPKQDSEAHPPGPKYYTPLRPEPGVAIGPKPRMFGKQATGSSQSPSPTAVIAKGAKQDSGAEEGDAQASGETEIASKTKRRTAAEELRDAGMRKPAHWAKRVGPKQYMGKGLIAAGQASPGPVYMVMGDKFQPKSKKKMIPRSYKWNP